MPSYPHCKFCHRQDGTHARTCARPKVTKICRYCRRTAGQHNKNCTRPKPKNVYRHRGRWEPKHKQYMHRNRWDKKHFKLTKEPIIKEMWKSGRSVLEIAETVGVKKEKVEALCRKFQNFKDRASKGGIARALKLTPEERLRIASQGGMASQNKSRNNAAGGQSLATKELSSAPKNPADVA